MGEIRRPADVDREQRAADKAPKAQAKAAAAVIDPTSGKQLYKTDRAATNVIASGLDSLLWYGDEHPSGAGRVPDQGGKETCDDRPQSCCARSAVSPGEWSSTT